MNRAKINSCGLSQSIFIVLRMIYNMFDNQYSDVYLIVSYIDLKIEVPHTGDGLSPWDHLERC